MKKYVMLALVLMSGCGTANSPKYVNVCGKDFLEHSDGTVTDIQGIKYASNYYISDNGCHYRVAADGKVYPY